MPPTRARRTDGRSLSATWSNWLGGWTEGGWSGHERKKYWVLDDYRTRGVFYRRRRRWAAAAISQQPPRHSAATPLPDVFLRDSRILESAGDYRHTRATFSAAEGMGIRRNFLCRD